MSVDVPKRHVYYGASDEARRHIEEADARDEAMVREMEAAGCTVLFGTASSPGTQVVKLRRPGHRQIQKSSTSWYPIEAIYEVWKSLTAPIAIVHFHTYSGEPVNPAHLLPTGRLDETGQLIIGYKHHASDPWIDITEPGRGIGDLVGLSEIYLMSGNPISAHTIMPRVRLIEAVQR